MLQTDTLSNAELLYKSQCATKIANEAQAKLRAWQTAHQAIELLQEVYREDDAIPGWLGAIISKITVEINYRVQPLRAIHDQARADAQTFLGAYHARDIS